MTTQNRSFDQICPQIIEQLQTLDLVESFAEN